MIAFLEVAAAIAAIYGLASALGKYFPIKGLPQDKANVVSFAVTTANCSAIVLLAAVSAASFYAMVAVLLLAAVILTWKKLRIEKMDPVELVLIVPISTVVLGTPLLVLASVGVGSALFLLVTLLAGLHLVPARAE